jgi:hypothetical protein
MLILHLKMRKRPSKKTTEILVDKQQQAARKFTIISTDELFFFYDPCKKVVVWIEFNSKDNRLSQTFMYI